MSSKSLVVVSGASGLLGRALLAKLNEALDKDNFEILGLAYSRSGPGLERVDLRDLAAVRSLVLSRRPALFVHAAAERSPDRVQADLEAARHFNVETSRAIAKAMKEVGGRVLYISTDYVFDGANPPYRVEDEARPINLYGELKLEGEKVVLAEDPNNVVLRIPVLYGPVEKLDESAVTVLFKTLQEKKETTVSDYEIRAPAHVDDIAAIVSALAQRLNEAMAEVFGLDASHVKGNAAAPTSTSASTRPKDVTMDTSRLRDLGIDPHTDFKKGIKKALEKWV